MKWTEVMVDRLRALAAEGLSSSEIARDLGCGITRKSVCGQAHKRGITLGAHDGRARPPQAKPILVAAEVKQRIKLNPAVVDLAARRLPKVVSQDAFTAAPDAYLVTLEELRPRLDCRWPYGQSAPFLFCGKVATDGSYCQAHGLLAYAGRGRPTLKVYAPSIKREARP